ncbi:MAG: FHA domain-containing protein [Gemmataceae bacterium]
MMTSPWLALRQTQEALRTGRADDAHRLLAPLVAEGHRKALRLLPQLANCYIARGDKFIRADNPEAAWKELLAAEALNTGEPRVAELRSVLTRLGVAECRAALEAGKPMHVIEVETRLRERNTRHPELSQQAEAAQDWILALEMADRGDFLLAKTTAERLRPKLKPPTTGFDQLLLDLDTRHNRFREAVAQLSEAAEVRNWRLAARHAEEVIAVAPAHREARHAQMQAWEAVSPRTIAYVPSDPLIELPPAAAEPLQPPSSRRVGHGPGEIPSRQSVSMSGFPKRFFLWIDGVGGYLVCMGNRVTFGQATSDAPIDVPLFADVSRLHAEISRDGEGYLLESSRGAQINGDSTTRTTLKNGDRLTLGSSCQLLFQQPVPISPSARLDLVSGHRLPNAIDGILLMADNLILGASDAVHVRMPWAESTIVLYRGREGLGVKIPGEFQVDNSACRERANLTLPAVITSSRFTFAIEPVGPRLG